MTDPLDVVRREIQLHLKVDWIGLWLFPHLIREMVGMEDDAEVRKASMELVREFLERDVIEAGDIDWDAGAFVSWGLEPSAALARIESEWSALGKEPGLSEIAWFALTEHGSKVVGR